jgi:hypothetical protein
MNDGSWLKGIGLTVLALVAGAALLGGIGSMVKGEYGALFLVLLTVLGVTQALWVVPLAIWARAEKKTLWGILVTAGFIFLLNSACWGSIALMGGLF